MRTLSAALVVLVVLASPVVGMGAERGARFEHARWSIRLPEGWTPADEARTNGQTTRFVDASGNYFEVQECTAQAGVDLITDQRWVLRWDGPGLRYDIARELRDGCTAPDRQACLGEVRREGGGDADFCCPVGDGRLQILAEPKVDAPAAFLFGNRRREEGVDLAPFRAMIRSFRSKRWPLTPGERSRRGC